MSDGNRRRFLQQSLAISAASAIGWQAQAAAPAPPASAAPAATTAAGLPKGKIGSMPVSRLLLGGNLLTHFTHSRDLRYVYNLAKHYNTEAKILETMAVAEQHGIDTVVIHTAPGVVDFLTKYREQRGGKIKWIICPTAPIEPGLAKFNAQVQELVDKGTDAIYIWGVRSDQLVKSGQAALIGKAVEAVKLHEVPCGIGAHLTEVVAECEKSKFPNDFYIKTLHHDKYPSAKLNHDSSWCKDPEQLVELMREVQKPWIAFKVMAAGAIPPQNAFQFAFDSGADFVLAGMFDFEIAEDVRIAQQILPKVKRTRSWRA